MSRTLGYPEAEKKRVVEDSKKKWPFLVLPPAFLAPLGRHLSCLWNRSQNCCAFSSCFYSWYGQHKQEPQNKGWRHNIRLISYNLIPKPLGFVDCAGPHRHRKAQWMEKHLCSCFMDEMINSCRKKANTVYLCRYPVQRQHQTSNDLNYHLKTAWLPSLCNKQVFAKAQVLILLAPG